MFASPTLSSSQLSATPSICYHPPILPPRLASGGLMRTTRPALIALILCSALALPSRAAAQGIPAEQLKKLKAATVFVKVAAGQNAGTGSGFLVRADGTTGYVVTNDHVVTMKWKVNMPGQPRAGVAVVFNSGEPDEWTAPGEIAAGDPERDLAVVRFRTNKKLPDPL